MLPIGGQAATATKWGKKALSKLDEAAAVAKHADEAISAGAKACQRARELGAAGEAAAGIVKNTERIPSLTGAAILSGAGCLGPLGGGHR